MSGSPQATDPTLRIGEFLVSPSEGTLRRGAVVERIEPKAMELLLCLARHPGRVLSRDQILSEVWPGTALADVVLPRVVYDLRRVLGDDAKRPSYIETLPKRGYRLIARVAEPRTPGRPPIPLIGTLALVATVGILGFRSLSGRKPEAGVAADARRARIVVLPFEHLGSEDEAWLAAGMTEEITSQLASVPGLAVIARTSAIQYADRRAPLSEVGRGLGVAWALEGSVRLEAEETPPRRVRVTSRLVRVEDETPVWSARFDRELGEGLQLQIDIARAVAVELGHELAGDRSSRPTPSLEAWRAYARGLAHVGGSQQVRAESVELGVDLLALAVDLDPGFALAWAELSRAHSWLYHLRHDGRPARCDEARSAAERALELEPDLPRAHLALGDVRYRCDRDYDGALLEYERAAASRPGDPVLLAATAYVQRRKGRFGEAVAGLEEALALDPLSASLAVDLGQTHLALRSYDAARSLFDRAIEQEPDLDQAWVSRAGVALLAEGDAAEALALLDAQPGGTDACARGEIEYIAGRHRSAARTLRDCKEQGIRLPYAVWPRALLAGWVHDGAGEPAAAARAFERARERLLEELSEDPDDFRLHAGLGLALAGLGDAAAAVRSGERALELFPVERDALVGPPLLLQIAWIHARLGDDSAVDLLERLLQMPAGGWLSTASATRDPRLKGLRDRPRFRALIAGEASQ